MNSTTNTEIQKVTFWSNLDFKRQFKDFKKMHETHIWYSEFKFPTQHIFLTQISIDIIYQTKSEFKIYNVIIEYVALTSIKLSWLNHLLPLICSFFY